MAHVSGFASGFLSDRGSHPLGMEWLRVPVGRDAAAWRTVPTERTVLAVVHTLACLGYVLDAVELLEPDQRVQVVFAQAPDLFAGGVPERLRALDAITIGWHQATHTDFDLVLAADSGSVHQLHGPVLALGHGVPNNKLAPPALGGPASNMVVGLSPPWLTWYGRVVPAAVALPHRNLLPVLERHCPQATPVAVVTGDLCLDRLRASRPYQHRYRDALGVKRPLVAVTSTWGPESLFARGWGVVSELLRSGQYDVAAVLHPAAWYGHGTRQVLGWLREQRRAGLLVVEPTSWRGLVAAADVLVGDHGSATAYAAGAGVPVLRAGGPATHTAPGSPVALTPMLAPDRPLAAQLREAAEKTSDATQKASEASEAANALTSEPGRAAGLLRTHMYRLMSLREPETACAAAPVPLPTLIKE
ncbi:hypothetical protein Pa4123_28860 [Phytohabitans aurantiacus]|uniref:Uncharacterized protein n=2 Tax=Phytohabitans aurantiacus TaxID=3016789 RepID=A0ABQ5QVD1_9ACTN|nr:hypothetical protein Pa4123_28860 [Phytohabitans aurantiacus]